MSYRKVFLKSGKAESLRRFHPWVFSGAIARIEGTPQEGEIVDVYTSDKEFIACGHYQVGSIAVRVLSFRQEPINHDFWVRKLSVALDLRRCLNLVDNPQNNTFRLVHGEGDNLPGLIIDVYGHTAVMQAHSVGMHVYRMEIAEALTEVMGDIVQNIYYKSETTLPFKADLIGSENGFIKGGSDENVALENGLKFHVDWLKGQKNRLLRRPARKPSPARTLFTRPQRAQHVLLYRRLLVLRHARWCPSGAFGRQLCQSHRPH